MTSTAALNVSPETSRQIIAGNRPFFAEVQAAVRAQLQQEIELVKAPGTSGPTLATYALANAPLVYGPLEAIVGISRRKGFPLEGVFPSAAMLERVEPALLASVQSTLETAGATAEWKNHSPEHPLDALPRARLEVRVQGTWDPKRLGRLAGQLASELQAATGPALGLLRYDLAVRVTDARETCIHTGVPIDPTGRGNT